MNNVFLNKDYTNTIKGILILLIVFGHNHFLCPNDVEAGLMNYLYLFHVHSFFILPFFYNHKADIDDTYIGKILVRNYIPYIWVCIVCFIAQAVYYGNFNFESNHLRAFIVGTQTYLHNYFGFIFPWFLPTYCFFTILFLFAKKSNYFYIMLLIAGAYLFTLTWNQFYMLKNITPFGSPLAVQYFFLGGITWLLVRLASWIKYVGTIIFIIFSVLYLCSYSIPFPFNNVIMPISFFMMVLTFVRYVDCSFLREIGKLSLPIYLMNVFVINFMCTIMPNTVLNGIIVLVLTLLITYYISWIVMYKFEKVRRIFFPKSWSEFSSVFFNVGN